MKSDSIENEKIQVRSHEIASDLDYQLSCTADRIFAVVMLFQWMIGIGFALASSSNRVGQEEYWYIHVYTAVFAGGLMATYSIYRALLRNGHRWNCYVMCLVQIGFSILYSHLTGGRVETQFHIFGSLAFLAFYRDIRPIILATILTGLDHLIRGALWPESIYGVAYASPWRALEHFVWVVFEDVFLVLSVIKSQKSRKVLAEKQAHLEFTIENIEKIVSSRTQALKDSQQIILDQQQVLVSVAKMSALGEMAAGMAHEINNPLAIIDLKVGQMEEWAKRDTLDKEAIRSSLAVIRKTVQRIAGIIGGLRAFSRDGAKDPMTRVSIVKLIEETCMLCRERFRNHAVDLRVEVTSELRDMQLECRPTEISQVLLNLLSNAYDAVIDLPQKWVRIEANCLSEVTEIRVVDSGKGISSNIEEKIMQPFFTTKGVGKGTGLGLSISRGIMEVHQGRLFYELREGQTNFILQIPRSQIKGGSVQKLAS